MMHGFGQEMQLPEVPANLKPTLPGYVTTEVCAAQVGVLQKKWDDHVPMMIAGGIAALAVGFFVGKAM